MESEKVKEIKEKLKEHYYYLDQAYSDYLAYGGKADEQQEEKIHFFGDILTLINELESENEKFVESCKNCHYIKDLEIANGHAQELKDRIVELERDKEKWQRKAINYYQRAKSYGVECIIDNDIDETLKEYDK